MPYNIGETLKKYRNEAKMSVKQISELLTQKGFKASESTIYSWENENSQPTPGALLVMCKAYGIDDVLSAFGYDGYKEDGGLQLTMSETNLIEKYRYIDDFGRDSVDHILKNEYNRKKQIEQQQTEQHEAELQYTKEESEEQPGLYARRIRRGGVANNAPPIPKKEHKMTKLNHFEGAYGAGGGQINDNATMITIEVSEDDVPEGADTTIDIAGDSMEPTLSDGDVVYVQHTNQLEIGDIGVFYLDGQNFIKEYGGDELISHNPEYAPIQISEFSTFVIQGKVLGKKIEGFVEL